MGGPVPLGYEVKNRKLVINDDEARTVRHIFERYAELGSGQLLLDELGEDGIRTKRRAYKDGSVRGGVPFTRGALFHLLNNRIYRGEMVHKGKAWPGEHEPIISVDLWERVCERITTNRVDRKFRHNAQEASLLVGMIHDGLGRKMSPSHTAKNGKRYRYYITHSSEVSADSPAWRLPAHDIERVVVETLGRFLEDRPSIRRVIGSDDATRLSTALSLCEDTAERVRASAFHRRTRIPMLVEHVEVGEAAITVKLSSAGLCDLLADEIDSDRVPTLTAAVCRIRKGKEVKLVIKNGPCVERDEAIVSLLREAMTVRDEVLAAPDQTIAEIAAKTGRCRKRLARLLRLSWLAPEIVDAVIEGRQLRGLAPRALLRTDLPFEWSRQKALLTSR